MEVEPEIPATLAAIRALEDVQHRMRAHFEREREKSAAMRLARAPRTAEERAACLRTIRRTLVQLADLALAAGLLLGLLYGAAVLARWIDGVLAS